MYILLFTALLNPTLLGTYDNEAACTKAIRTIYEQRFAAQSVNTEQVKKILDTTMQYQREYKCVKQGT